MVALPEADFPAIQRAIDTRLPSFQALRALPCAPSGAIESGTHVPAFDMCDAPFSPTEPSSPSSRVSLGKGSCVLRPRNVSGLGHCLRMLDVSLTSSRSSTITSFSKGDGQQTPRRCNMAAPRALSRRERNRSLSHRRPVRIAADDDCTVTEASSARNNL